MDERTITISASAGWCAWDVDECWVTVAFDTPEEMDALLSQLKPRNRVRLVPDEESA